MSARRRYSTDSNGPDSAVVTSSHQQGENRHRHWAGRRSRPVRAAASRDPRSAMQRRRAPRRRCRRGTALKSDPCQRPATRTCSDFASLNRACSRARSALVSGAICGEAIAAATAARAIAGNQRDGRSCGCFASLTCIGTSIGRQPRVDADTRQTMVAPGGRPPGQGRTRRHGSADPAGPAISFTCDRMHAVTRARSRERSSAT